jgi:hypothetical protein
MGLNLPSGAVSVATRVAPLVVRLLWHPKLVIRFEWAQTLAQRGHRDSPGRKATYLHVVCANNARFVRAAPTSAWMSSLEVWQQGKGFVLHSEFVGPLSLHWANTTPWANPDFQAQEIEPRQYRRIDIAYILDGENTLRLFKSPHSGGIISVLRAGTYRFEVEVRPSNCNPLRPRVRTSFRLDFGGSVDSITVRPESRGR